MNHGLLILLIVHIVCAVIWVGGMVFAHFMLRPASLALDPPVRLPLWRRVFERFFPTVWVLIVLLLATGFGMMFLAFGGFAGAALYIQIMMGIGIVMMLAYAHLYFVPWQRMRRALDAGNFPGAGAAMNQIRQIVTLNMALGLIVVAVAATGRYWG